MAKAVGNRLLIKQASLDEKSKGGVYIPSNATSQPNVGEVLSKGAAVTDEIKIGDKAIFLKYSASGMTLYGEELLFVTEKDVVGILD